MAPRPPGSMPSGPERDKLIVKLWEQGENLRGISEEVGISRERVRQILAGHYSHADD
jgi:DNA-directed RNA polymerase sigma subunit (sigma70/sigma32)